MSSFLDSKKLNNVKNVKKKNTRKQKEEEKEDKYWNKWDDYEDEYFSNSYVPWLGTYTEADRRYDEKWHPNGESNFYSPDAMEEVANGYCEPDWMGESKW